MKDVTIYEIAAKTSLTYDQVRYALRRLRIEPVRTIGRNQMYAGEVTAAIRQFRDKQAQS